MTALTFLLKIKLSQVSILLEYAKKLKKRAKRVLSCIAYDHAFKKKK